MRFLYYPWRKRHGFFLSTSQRTRVKQLLLFLSLVFLSACDIDQSPLNMASDMLERGVTLFEEGDYQQSEVFLTQAISLYEQAKDYAKAAEAHLVLSEIGLAQGQFRTALEQAQTAFEQSTSANDFRGQARVHLQQGDIQKAMGEYERALDHYESSHSLSAAFDDKPSIFLAEMLKAGVYYRLSRWDLAQRSYETSLNYYRSVNDDPSTALALMGIGETYFQQRRYGEALNSFTQAQHSLDSDDLISDARLHLDLGIVYRAMNEGNTALRYFRDGANSLRARKTAKEYEALLLFSIGTVYYESSRWEDAKRFFNEAVAIAREAGDRISESYLYLFIARTTESQIPASQRDFQLEKRVQTYEQIAQRFQDCGHKTGEAYSYVQIGTLYQNVGRLAEAREAYQRAIDLDEERTAEYLDTEVHLSYQRELGIEQSHEEWYRRLAAVLLQLRRSEDALRYLDRGRSRAVSNMIVEADVSIRNIALQNEMSEFRSQNKEYKLQQLELSSMAARRQANPQVVNQLRLQITRMRENLKKMSDRISQTYPNYGPLTGTVNLVRVDELQPLIPRGSIVVTYLPAQDYLYIFVLSRTSFSVHNAAVGSERLLGMVDEYKRLLKDPNVFAGSSGEASLPAMTRFATLSTQLYDVLIRPIDGMLDRSLVIIAGKEFENFPFQTIERENKNGVINYLIELTSVDYLASFSNLKFRTAGATRIRNVVALGNPTGKNWSVDYELRDIRSFFKEAVVQIGFEATWENLKSARQEVAQISSEFENNPGNEPFGSIALSDGTTIEESIEIPFERLTSLPAFPVMVLSNTLGQGVGLTPLHAYLLRLNGTSDVFYNAWSSERKATKFFSEFFYTHLSNGLAPGDAYRQAILNLIQTQEVNHPFSWGQFFHYGIG